MSLEDTLVVSILIIALAVLGLIQSEQHSSLRLRVTAIERQLEDER